MLEFHPPQGLVTELGTAYKNYQIEITDLISMSYASGFSDCTNSQYRKLCSALLKAIDAGNSDAEELVLCQIRTALKLEAQ